MRALVTGAAGFLGSHLVDRLVADGHHVTGLDDLSVGRLANLADARRHKGCGFHRFDILSPDLPELVGRDRPDVVVHLAATAPNADPLSTTRVNVLGTVNVLQACVHAGVPRVVLASSGQVYGEPATLPVGERAATRPVSPYGASKLAAEAYLEVYQAQHGLAGVSLRLGNVYGPRQDPPGVLSLFARALLDGRPAKIHGDGTGERDYVHIDDAVDAFLRCLGGKGDGRRLNIGTGQGTALRELHRLVAADIGAADAPEFVGGGPSGPKALALESGAARRALGWEPVVGLASGIARTVAWLRENPRKH